MQAAGANESAVRGCNENVSACTLAKKLMMLRLVGRPEQFFCKLSPFMRARAREL